MAAPAPLTAEELARAKLLQFCRYMSPQYEVAGHHRVVADALERVARGECKRLMLFLPPRHGKSFLASTHFPAWFLGRSPAAQIIACTYAQEFADDIGRSVRNLVAEPEYGRVFPGVSLRSDSTSAKRFHTNAKGVYAAVGAGGPITGRGAHLLLIDDPLKNREEADSPTVRRRLKDWYTSTAYTRLMPGGAIVVIQTRWHEDDLAGWLLKEHAHEGWEVLSLPAVAERDEAWPLRGGEFRRSAGDALWPAWYPLSRLQEIKRSVGSRDWSALYQQRPMPDEGGTCQVGWFRRYSEPPTGVRRILQSWDVGSKDKETNDPSVCVTLAETDAGLYVLDVLRDRMIYPVLRRTVEDHARRRFCGLPVSAVLVEDKGNGISLLQDLGASTRLPLIPVEPDGSKLVRWARVTPTIEARRVWLPVAAPWLVDFESELSGFPAVAHDDQVDALSQALNWLRDGAAVPSDEDAAAAADAALQVFGRRSYDADDDRDDYGRDDLAGFGAGAGLGF